MSNYSKSRYKNVITGGTGALQLPVGTTAQRPGEVGSEITSAASGQLRFNSTLNRTEQYTGTAWIALDAPPTITNISPTQVDPSQVGPSGTLLTINGSRFSNDASVVFGSTTAATITVVNENQITCRAPSGLAVGSYNVEVINGSGLSARLVNGFSVDSAPIWTTPSGSLGTVTNSQAISTITLVANDPDDGATVTYALQGSSLPTGLSLNTSNGQITGTPSGYSSEVTESFTIRATGTNTDGSTNTTDRSFTITVRPQATVSSISATSGAPGDTITINGTNFVSGATVDFNGATVTPTSVTSTAIQFTVPGGVASNALVGKSSMTGGTNWFDANSSYYGVYPSYRLQNGVKYTQVKYRLPSTSSTAGRYWWAIAWTRTSARDYVIRAAAKIQVASGNNGDIITANFSDATTKIGLDGDGNGFTVPSSGDYFVGWFSGNGGGSNNPGGSFWSDSGSESTGVTQYFRSDTAPSSAGTTISMSNDHTAGQMHFQWIGQGYDVKVQNPAVTVNSVTQTPTGVTATSSFVRNFVSSTYNYTGSDQTFAVPTGVTKVDAFLWGAGGGGGNRGGWANGSNAGSGGFTFSSITTTPGENLTLVVGRPGKASPQFIGTGYGGGGGANTDNGDNRYSGTGGGYAGVFRGSASQANALCIAGAGGGGGSSRNGNTCRGGAGGGESGEGGFAGQGSGPGAGTQNAGGGGGSYGVAGGALAGGQSPSGHPYGGGGGGGYYGGGSGGYAEPDGMNGGGGGSGRLLSGSWGYGTLARGPSQDRTPRETASQYYGNSAGVGGGGSTDAGLSDGGPARIVIIY